MAKIKINSCILSNCSLIINHEFKTFLDVISEYNMDTDIQISLQVYFEPLIYKTGVSNSTGLRFGFEGILKYEMIKNALTF